MPVVPNEQRRRLFAASLDSALPLPLVQGLNVLGNENEEAEVAAAPDSPSFYDDSLDSDNVGKVLLERSN